MKAILVGIHLPEVDDRDFKSSMEELGRLVETLGYEVVGTLTQKRKSVTPSTAIGGGKLKELAAWTGGTGKIPAPPRQKSKAALKLEMEAPPEPEHEESHDFAEPTDRADTVIFDQELTPNQLTHLEKATGAEILDRTGVIVEIFHRHAKTQEARAQVEIARLKYLAPRLRASGGGERQGGGIGSKGIGETAHELDRRRIRDRIAELQRELENLHKGQANRRARRRDECRVALVGYTNAGKSSMMRALTGDAVLVANKLFATLDTTVRAMEPDIFPRVLVSDTVGFIQKLPHDLVASFRSTLDEAGDASLLLYVVDASDPTFREQLEVTKTVLSEIDAAEIPSKLLLNKSDLLDIVQTKMLAKEFPDALIVSTKNPEDVARIKTMLREFFGRNMEEMELLVPYTDKSGLLGEVRKHAAILKETHEQEGVRMIIRSFPEQLARLKKR
jgi:GTP-binding protein HflX